MDYTTMTIEALMARRSEIGTLLESDDADLDALEAEVRAINEELERRRAAEERRAALRNAVASGAGDTVESIETEERTMTIDELRSNERYINAFAGYLRSGNDAECRSLMTEIGAGSGNGGVPVPAFVDEIIHHAWENDEILSRVSKSNLRGNLKVGFERSADGAYAHTEGTTAVTEESLQLGIVTMIPKMIKKWITITDEAMAMGGEAFVRYIYEELAYQITKKLASDIVGDIVAAGTSHSATAVGITKSNIAPSVVAIPTAAANLSDEARNVVVIMNRLTEVEFISAFASGNFAVDPFAGLTKVYTSALPAYSTASTNDTYAIVGDLSGARVNFPEGEGIAIKFDDLSLSEKDLVKVVGREYAAHAVVGPGKFARLTKPAAATT